MLDEYGKSNLADGPVTAFSLILMRTEKLLNNLDKHTDAIRSKVVKLAIEVNESGPDRKESVPLRTPDTVIERLNDLVFKLEL